METKKAGSPRISRPSAKLGHPMKDIQLHYVKKESQRETYSPRKGRWHCPARGCMYTTDSYHNLISHEEEHGTN